MGFIKNERLRKFEFKHFKVSHTRGEPAPDYEEKSVHNPSTNSDDLKYVQGFDAIEGVVTAVEWYDRKDNSGQRYVGYALTVDAGEEVVNLDFPYGKPAYRVLTRHGRNVDWSRPVKFSCWQSANKMGKPVTGVCFWQQDKDGKYQTVKSAHTMDNPNGCPQPEQGVKGLNWDGVERWLKTEFDRVVVPAIQSSGASHGNGHDKPKDELEGARQFAKAKAASVNVGAFSDGTPLPEPPEDYDDIPF